MGASSADRLPEIGFIAPEFVRIPNGEGFDMEAALVRPPDFDPSQRYPMLLHVYGGPHAPLVRDQWGGLGSLWRSDLARRGYVVMVVDPQSASGKGDASAYAMHRNAGETELRDLTAAVDWAVHAGWADPERIGIFGWSYGGFMAAYSLTHSTQFRMGISGAPVTDWHLYDSIWTERYLDDPDDNPTGYEASSPRTHAAHLEDALLIVHGTGDDNVHPQNTLRLLDDLVAAEKMFEVAIYPGQKHGFRGLSSRHFYRRMTEFFDRHLGGGESPGQQE